MVARRVLARGREHLSPCCSGDRERFLLTIAVSSVARQSEVEVLRALRHCDGLGIDAESGATGISFRDANRLKPRIAAWQQPRSKSAFWTLPEIHELAVLDSHREHAPLDVRQLCLLLEIDIEQANGIVDDLVSKGELVAKRDSRGSAGGSRSYGTSGSARRLSPGSAILQQSPHLWNIKRAVRIGRQVGVDRDMRNWDLVGANFRGLDLSRSQLEGADLGRACLVGASLKYRNLRGANLRGADLSDADLSGADFSGATASERTVWPAGFDPETRGVELHTLESDTPPRFVQDALVVPPSVSKADLPTMALVRADLAGRDLAGVRFEKTNMERADLRGANLSRATFEGVRGGYLDASDAVLDEVCLDRASVWRLAGASLVGADVRGADLSSLNCREADLRGLKADGATIQNCDFTNANLEGASFKSVFINGCRFNGANLRNADLRFRRVDAKPDFTGADVVGARPAVSSLRKGALPS